MGNTGRKGLFRLRQRSWRNVMAHAGDDYPLLADDAVSRAKSIRIPLLSWLNLGGVFSPFSSEPQVNTGAPTMATDSSSG